MVAIQQNSKESNYSLLNSEDDERWFTHHAGYYIALGRSYKRSMDFDLSERALLKASLFNCTQKQKIDINLLLAIIYTVTERINFASKLYTQLNVLINDVKMTGNVYSKYCKNIENLNSLINLKLNEKNNATTQGKFDFKPQTLAKDVNEIYTNIDILLDNPKQDHIANGSIYQTQLSPIVNQVMISKKYKRDLYFSLRNNWPINNI